MKTRTAITFVFLYLELTVAQVQLKVYRGTLVHSRELKQIEVLQDHLLGFDANNRGEVSINACPAVYTQYQDSYTVYVHKIYVQCSKQRK